MVLRNLLSYDCQVVYFLSQLVQIGVDFALKVINWDADTLIRLQLWDIAGEQLVVGQPGCHGYTQ